MAALVNKWPSVYPRHLLGAAFDSAFNLRARFYFWARQGQGEPRPRGRSIEGPGCLPGPLRASLPKQHVGEGALGSAEWWGAAHSALAVRAACLPPSNLGPQVGSPGRACDGLGRGQGVLSVAWQPPCPRLTAPWSTLRDAGFKPLLETSGPVWSLYPLGVGFSHPGHQCPRPLPQSPRVECREERVLSLIKYSRARSSIFLFYAFRVAVYF